MRKRWFNSFVEVATSRSKQDLKLENIVPLIKDDTFACPNQQREAKSNLLAAASRRLDRNLSESRPMVRILNEESRANLARFLVDGRVLPSFPTQRSAVR